MKRRVKFKRRHRNNRYLIIPIISMVIFLIYTGLNKITTINFFDFIDFSPQQTVGTFPSSPDLTRNIPDTLPPNEEIPPTLPAIKDITISGDSSKAFDNGVFIQNRSKLDIDIATFLQNKMPISLAPKGVQVLIVHTHGSESYTPTDENYYVPTENDRTTDTNYNVVRIGDEMEKILKEKGINVLHIRDIFDSPSYSGSYTRSLEAIRGALKNHPSISVIIDIHRDAMIAKDGTKYKTVADINGEKVAQLMFVTGTSGGDLSHENWKKNLTFHAKLQAQMNTKYPGIMRPINIRNERFNQHVCPGSMLLEVGTSGNTLEEALSSIRLFSSVLADTIK